MKNESPEDRVAQLHKMLKNAPNDVFLAFVLGLEYQKRNDYINAIACFDLALSSDENYLAAYYQKSISLAEINQIKAAVDSLEAGLQRAKAKGDQKTIAEMNNLRMNLLIDLD